MTLHTHVTLIRKLNRRASTKLHVVEHIEIDIGAKAMVTIAHFSRLPFLIIVNTRNEDRLPELRIVKKKKKKKKENNEH